MDKITVTPLKQITHPKGDLFHALKKSEDSFNGFGEAYFSTVNKNDIKAWKRHKKMRCNLIVPVGAVKFVVYNSQTDKYLEITLSQKNYQRLTIPPNYWFGFMGIDEYNLILNIADIEHCENETDRKEIKEMQYDWL